MQNLAIMFSKQRQIELRVQLLWWYFEFFFINYLLLLSGLDPSPPETSGSSATDFRGRRIGLFSAQILKQRLEIGRNKALCHESRLHVARWQLFRVMQTNLVYSIKIFETKKKLRVLFTFTKMSDRSHLNFNLVPRKIESLKHCYCSRKHLSLVFHDNLYYYWYSFWVVEEKQKYWGRQRHTVAGAKQFRVSCSTSSWGAHVLYTTQRQNETPWEGILSFYVGPWG